MKKLFKKFAAIGMAAMVIMAMGVTAFAASPTVCKFTKADGSNLSMNMDVGMIESADLENGVATVKFKDYTLLWYTGSISNIEGEAVLSFDADSDVAVIDMSYDDDSGLAGVPVTITFDFNMTPPGMSDSMNARFVCK